MRRFLILVAAALLCSCAGRNRYTVEGTVVGDDRTLYLCEGDSICDSTRTDNGAYRFRGSADRPRIVMLYDAPDGSGALHAIVILEPGQIVIVPDSTDEGRFFATGTPSNDAFKHYAEMQEALVEEFRNPATSEERRVEIAQQAMLGLVRRMVQENRDNFFGVQMLSQASTYDLSEQELLDEISLFTPEMQQTGQMVRLKERAELQIRTAVGQPYTDISQPDADGKEISLRSVVENSANKYVLLDFWASWCGPCMGEVPHLKKAYDAFHEKGFEIYGVSLDSNRDKWLAAIRKNDMKWIQVCSFEEFDNQAAREYAIRSIPSNLLIDHEGKIVAKNLRGEELCEKMAELLD